MYLKTLIWVLTLCLVSSFSRADDEVTFVAKLRSHYKETLKIQSYTLQYHFLNSVYRDNHYWDYKTPNRHWSRRTIEVDMEKRHFYDNDTLYFTGGRVYDRVQFQNDKESFFYEKSGSSLGKGIIKRGMNNFDNFIKHQVMNVDFMAVRPLLLETDIKDKISLQHDDKSSVTTLIHTPDEGTEITYKFRSAPVQLISIDKGIKDGLFVYADYQTTGDYSYARSVNKYYDGATEPNYISFNDHFDVITSIAPYKLKVPEGYGPEIKRGDGILVSEAIGENLYLVTDSSASRNALLYVVGNKISIFGAAGNERFAEKTMQLVKEQFQGRVVESVYVTHPHRAQIAGLTTFVEQGIEILADGYTIEAIKAYPKFKKDIDTFRFREIENEQVWHGVHFYILENMLSKRQSFVYFEDSGILFQSSFLHIPFDNTVSKFVPTYSRAFIDFLRGKQLNVNRVVGNYRNNNISVEVMNKVYDAMM